MKNTKSNAHADFSLKSRLRDFQSQAKKMADGGVLWSQNYPAQAAPTAPITTAAPATSPLRAQLPGATEAPSSTYGGSELASMAAARQAAEVASAAKARAEPVLGAPSAPTVSPLPAPTAAPAQPRGYQPMQSPFSGGFHTTERSRALHAAALGSEPPPPAVELIKGRTAPELVRARNGEPTDGYTKDGYADGGRATLRDFGTGGKVRGPGTTTSDSIPAMLSKGEYVLPADTVQQVGVENLDQLREQTHKPVGPVQGVAAAPGVLTSPLRGYRYGGEVSDKEYFRRANAGIEVGMNPPIEEINMRGDRITQVGGVAPELPPEPRARWKLAPNSESGTLRALRAAPRFVREYGGKVLGKAAAPVAVGLEAMNSGPDVMQVIEDPQASKGDVIAAAARPLSRLAGMTAGAGLGAGLMAPTGPGALVAGAIGGGIGYVAPDAITWAGRKIFGGYDPVEKAQERGVPRRSPFTGEVVSPSDLRSQTPEGQAAAPEDPTSALRKQMSDQGFTEYAPNIYQGRTENTLRSPGETGPGQSVRTFTDGQNYRGVTQFKGDDRGNYDELLAAADTRKAREDLENRAYDAAGQSRYEDYLTRSRMEQEAEQPRRSRSARGFTPRGDEPDRYSTLRDFTAGTPARAAAARKAIYDKAAQEDATAEARLGTQATNAMAQATLLRGYASDAATAAERARNNQGEGVLAARDWTARNYGGDKDDPGAAADAENIIMKGDPKLRTADLTAIQGRLSDAPPQEREAMLAQMKPMIDITRKLNQYSGDVDASIPVTASLEDGSLVSMLRGISAKDWAVGKLPWKSDAVVSINGRRIPVRKLLATKDGGIDRGIIEYLDRLTKDHVNKKTKLAVKVEKALS